MSFFSRIKNTFTVNSNLHEKWSVPETKKELELLFKADSGLQLIYKHSDACMTCLFTKKRVEELMGSNEKIQSFHYIEVRMNRELSNFVSDKTGIRHESPQAILLRNGEVVWHASHSAIDIDPILNAIKSIN
jgi:bacillithiol system protein YtxJ